MQNVPNTLFSLHYYRAECAECPTLVSLIIVQDGLNVQAGTFIKINKSAGWNKAVQVGIFKKLLK